MHASDFVISFTEESFSYEEEDTDTEVCLEGVGEIARPATATVSSITSGTATGYT